MFSNWYTIRFAYTGKIPPKDIKSIEELLQLYELETLSVSNLEVTFAANAIEFIFKKTMNRTTKTRAIFFIYYISFYKFSLAIYERKDYLLPV